MSCKQPPSFSFLYKNPVSTHLLPHQPCALPISSSLIWPPQWHLATGTNHETPQYAILSTLLLLPPCSVDRQSIPVCTAALWDHRYEVETAKDLTWTSATPTVYLPMTLWEKICPTTCNTVGCSRDIISGWSSITFSNVSMVFSKPIAVMAFSSEPSSVSRTWLNVAAFRNKGITWKWVIERPWMNWSGRSTARYVSSNAAC